MVRKLTEKFAREQFVMKIKNNNLQAFYWFAYQSTKTKISSICNRRHTKTRDFHLEATRNAVRYSDI
jgi:hypothetical protein